MIEKFKCYHCGNNDKDKAKEYDGPLNYEAIICDCCGWIFDRNGAHPPEASELAKRVDWQKCHALICYAPNMYGFLCDIESHTGDAMHALTFLKGWMKGFKMKINREGAELQRSLKAFNSKPPEQPSVGLDSKLLNPPAQGQL